MMGHWEVPEGKRDKMQGGMKGTKGSDGSGRDKIQRVAAVSPQETKRKGAEAQKRAISLYLAAALGVRSLAAHKAILC